MKVLYSLLVYLPICFLFCFDLINFLLGGCFFFVFFFVFCIFFFFFGGGGGGGSLSGDSQEAKMHLTSFKTLIVSVQMSEILNLLLKQYKNISFFLMLDLTIDSIYLEYLKILLLLTAFFLSAPFPPGVTVILEPLLAPPLCWQKSI